MADRLVVLMDTETVSPTVRSAESSTVCAEVLVALKITSIPNEADHVIVPVDVLKVPFEPFSPPYAHSADADAGAVAGAGAALARPVRAGPSARSHQQRYARHCELVPRIPAHHFSFLPANVRPLRKSCPDPEIRACAATPPPGWTECYGVALHGCGQPETTLPRRTRGLPSTDSSPPPRVM